MLKGIIIYTGTISGIAIYLLNVALASIGA